LVYDLPIRGAGTLEPGQTADPAQEQRLTGVAIREVPAGKNLPAHVRGHEPSSATVTSFIGRDTSTHGKVPAWNTVSLGEVWQGIELRLRAHRTMWKNSSMSGLALIPRPSVCR